MGEQDDEWAISRLYMSLESLAQARIRTLAQSDDEPEEVAALEATGQNTPQRPMRHRLYTTSLEGTATGGK